LLKRIFETEKYRKIFAKGDTCSVTVLIIILSYLHILAVFKNKGKLFGPELGSGSGSEQKFRIRENVPILADPDL
jgi:hypothetical protein